MLERLKEAYYRRTRGGGEAALILRVEAALARISATEAFCRWVWSLPPELWEEAVEWRAATDDLVRRREQAVRLITRRNRLRLGSSGSPETSAVEKAVNRAKAELIELEHTVREGRARFVTFGDEPPA